MAEFPAPTAGFVATHFIVVSDVERSRRFYTEVLGGETVRWASRHMLRWPTAGSSSTSAAVRPTTSQRSRLDDTAESGADECVPQSARRRRARPL